MSDCDEGDREGDRAYDGRCCLAHRFPPFHHAIGCTGFSPRPPGDTGYKYNTPSETAQEMNLLLRALEAPVCPTHKRYQGKCKPRLPCEACWRRYIHLNPG